MLINSNTLNLFFEERIEFKPSLRDRLRDVQEESQRTNSEPPGVRVARKGRHRKMGLHLAYALCAEVLIDI